MNKLLRCACVIAAVAATASPSAAAELLQNGDFSAGLSGWTSYLTPAGTISPTKPNQGGVTPTNSPAEVASFNVTGSGASNALWLNAGQGDGPYGAANPAGGGVSQTFTSVAGIATFAADIAATTRLSTDVGGLFSVLLDGVALATYDFATITGTTRNALAFTTNLTAGAHTLQLQVVRPFGPAATVRSQYFDNVSLDLAAAAAVPEPASWAMMIAGFGLVGGAMRRRTAQAGFVA